jgi:hypothetical protein
MAKLFKILPDGRLANLMFQYMFAHAVKQRVPDLQISGVQIKEWGLFDDANAPVLDEIDPRRTVQLNGHRFSLSKLARMLNQGRIQCIELAGWACRAEYYEDNRNLFSSLFTPPSAYAQSGYSDEHLLIHVRAEDIVAGKHPDYMPTPIPFIKAVIQETGLIPVFMGQIGEDWYSQQLRSEFTDATFIPPGAVIEDFELIRKSKNVLISVSTFSWLASWLSDTTKNIYMPILGFFNPAQRPDPNLVPKNDPRYHCYQFPVIRYRGDPEQIRNPRFKKANWSSIKRQELKGRLLRR